MSKRLVLKEISVIKTEKERKDGRKSREYYSALFQDAENPFLQGRTRNFFQQHSPDGKEVFWRGGDPAEIRKMLGKEVPGYIATREVEPYVIKSVLNNQEVEREVTQFTMPIFEGENEGAVFKQSGHPLAGSQGTGVGAMSASQYENNPAIRDEQARIEEGRKLKDGTTRPRDVEEDHNEVRS